MCGVSRHIFIEDPSITFHVNPSSGSRADICGRAGERTNRQTEGHDDAKIAFRDYANAPGMLHAVILRTPLRMS